MELLRAIADGDVDRMKRALAAGESPNSVDAAGVSALHHAVEGGRIQLIGALLDAGAGLERPDAIGWTPLMAAIAIDDEPMVDRLLVAGANANHVAREDTPLSVAVTDSGLGTIRRLLQHGADPGLRRPDGWTPLMLAAFKGDIPLIRELLEAGADPTVAMGIRLMDAPMVAAAHGHADASELLLEAAHAADPDPADLWDQVHRWCATHAPDLAARFGTTEPQTPPSDWGPIPEAVHKQLTHWRAGLPHYDYDGLSLAEAIAEHEALCADMRPDFVPERLGPDEPVARAYWRAGWIPIAKDTDGNLLLVDLEPRANGLRGQLVSWSRQDGPLSVLASGLIPYLQQLVTRIRTGRAQLDTRTGRITAR